MSYTILAVIAAAFAIWAMVDLSQSSIQNQLKVRWFALVILIPLIGPIAYYLRRESISKNQSS